MKGRCALCNNNFFTRLDRHQLRKHNIVTSQKTPNLRQQVQEDPDMSRLLPHEDGCSTTTFKGGRPSGITNLPLL